MRVLDIIKNDQEIQICKNCKQKHLRTFFVCLWTYLYTYYDIFTLVVLTVFEKKEWLGKRLRINMKMRALGICALPYVQMQTIRRNKLINLEGNLQMTLNRKVSCSPYFVKSWCAKRSWLPFFKYILSMQIKLLNLQTLVVLFRADHILCSLISRILQIVEVNCFPVWKLFIITNIKCYTMYMCVCVYIGSTCS